MGKALQFVFALTLILSPVSLAGASIGLALSSVLSIVVLAQNGFQIQWKLLWPFMAYFALVLAGMLWTDNTETGWRAVQVSMSFLLFPFVAQALKYSGFTRSQLGLSIAISTLVGLVVMVTDTLTNGLENELMRSITGSRLSLPFIHRAYFMNYIVFVILLWLTIKRKAAWIEWIIVGILAIAFWLLQGRMNHIALGLLIPFIIWFGVKSNQQNSLFGLGFVVVLIASGFASGLIPTRFNAAALEKESTGIETTNPEHASRRFLWETSLTVIKTQPILGVGTGDVHDELDARYVEMGFEKGIDHSFNSHNQYLQSLLTFGPLGLLMLLAMFGFPFLKAIQNKDLLLGLWLAYYGMVISTESYFDRFHGVFLFGATVPFLLLTTSKE